MSSVNVSSSEGGESTSALSGSDSGTSSSKGKRNTGILPLSPPPPPPPPAKSPGTSPFYFLSRPRTPLLLNEQTTTAVRDVRNVNSSVDQHHDNNNAAAFVYHGITTTTTAIGTGGNIGGGRMTTTTRSPKNQQQQHHNATFITTTGTGGGSDSNGAPSTSLGTPSDNEYNSSLTTESGFSDPIPSRPVFQNLPQIIKNDDEYTSRTSNQSNNNGNNGGSAGLKLLAGFFGKTTKGVSQKQQQQQQQQQHTTNKSNYENVVPLLGLPTTTTTTIAATGTNNLNNSHNNINYNSLQQQQQQQIHTEGKYISRAGATGGATNIYSTTFNSSNNPVDIPVRLLKVRKLKIEPKVPLANERTLLAWFHWATLLTGSSIALSSFHSSVEKQHPMQQIIGSLLLLPFSIIVIIYSLNQYITRTYMIEHGISSHDGQFYDKYGPLTLGSIMLFVLTIIFMMKLF